MEVLYLGVDAIKLSGKSHIATIGLIIIESIQHRSLIIQRSMTRRWETCDELALLRRSGPCYLHESTVHPYYAILINDRRQGKATQRSMSTRSGGGDCYLVGIETGGRNVVHVWLDGEYTMVEFLSTFFPSPVLLLPIAIK
jgi:hypothetical protein